MTETLLTETVPAHETDGGGTEPQAATVPERPDDVPEKFWDSASGSLRTEALLKSYRELERKLGAAEATPAGDDAADAEARPRHALGVPARPEDYAIEAPHELLQADPEVNARLHAAGFTPAQAQLVYELVADRLLPLLDDAVQELEATRQVERLTDHFGGREKWQALARQIGTWGRANLAEDTYATLASSYDGVVALHEMMRVREPSVLRGDADGAPGQPDEAELRGLMRDPRYWRDRDPALVNRVTEGFKRLYPS